MPQWNKSTARVLSRLRDFSWPTVQWQPTDREKGCIHRVWVFVGVRLEEYDKNWDFVGAGLPKCEKLALREGVRQRLLTVFAEAAFSEDADEANGALGSFQRQNLLDWGDRLLATDAAANAAGPTVTDDDSTGLDTAVSVVLANLPEETRLIVEGIMEEAAAKGYEISDCDELLRYARNRYVEAAAEFGAVDAARDAVLPPALPQDAAQPGPFDDDLSELYENVSRSRSGRDGASVISDFSLSSRLSGLSFVSRREALQRLHRDMLQNRVRVDTIPGLRMKKTKRQLKKVGKVIEKELNSWGKKIGKAFKM